MEVRLSPGAVGSRLEVLDCFQRGWKTRRQPPLPVEGPCLARDELWASFSLRIEQGRVAAMRFRAPACTTLIAYCQTVADHAADRPLAEVVTLDADTLVAQLRGVPPMRQDRAILAAAAARAAAIGAAESESSDSQREKTQ